MKNKKSLWLAVATLVLCLGVMATGIYAVKTALLNVTGKLGFNMHDCIVEVNGTIYNLAEKDVQSGTYKKTNRTISNAIMGAEKSDTITTTNLDLGALEFYKGENIIFEFTFKNLSSHMVIASFKIDEITGVEVVESALYDTLPTTKIISIGGTISLTFALQLTDEDAYRDTTNPFNLEANFEEFEILGDSTNGYYIEMGTEDGTSNGTPLKWYPFAKLDTSGNVTSKLSDETFSYKNQLTSGTYYFISEKVFKSNEMAFRAANVNGANENGYTGTVDNNYGLDYNGSTIQQYITGDMLTEYSISDDLIYSAITKRLLAGEAYKYYDENGTLVTDQNVRVTHDTPDQSLWLLNFDEFRYLESTENTPASAYGYPLSGTAAVCWWLRSPSAVSGQMLSSTAMRALDIGPATSNFALRYTFGVRPAFQITIV